MTLRTFARKLRRSLMQSEPLITVSISRERLLANLEAYRVAYPNAAIAPVLKSNAYGHGLAVVAEILDSETIAFFMVDSLYEARVLRKSGIRSRIVVMGYARPEAIAGSRLARTDYAVTDIEQLRALASIARSDIRIHLKIDTGMHRQGIMPGDLEEAIALVRSNRRLCVAGVATHLADADSEDQTFTDRQLAVWDDAVVRIEREFPSVEYRHCAATKGSRASLRHPSNVLRIGMGLYGYDTAASERLGLAPALSMRSFIASLRAVAPGESVGYNATFKTERPSVIATVPAGYYEGIDRGLSNKGALLVNGVPAPIIGRVSMNMTSLDVTDVPGAKRGDTVTLISREPEDPNSVRRMALAAGTSPYVILAHLPAHLYRVIE